jgi:diaminopimelate epimerase
VRANRWEAFYDEVGPEQAHARLAELDPRPRAGPSERPPPRRPQPRARGVERERDRLWSGRRGTRRSIVGLDVPKEELDRRIDERTRAMFAAGVRAEAERALAGPISSTAAYAHGLSDIAEHPDDEDAIEALTPARDATPRTSASGCDAYRALLACLPIAPPGEIADAILEVARARQRYLLVERAELAFPLTAEARPERAATTTSGGSTGSRKIVSTGRRLAEVVIWNTDGSTAELSGNGTRIVPGGSRGRRASTACGSTSAARGRGHDARGKLVETEMGEVEVGDRRALHVDGKQYEMVRSLLAIPHAVVAHGQTMTSSSCSAPRSRTTSASRTGRTCSSRDRRPARRDRRGLGARSGGDALVRDERVAVASAAVRHGWCESPVTVHLQGGDLSSSSTSDYPRALTGPAEEICTRGALGGVRAVKFAKRLDAVPPYLFAELERKVAEAGSARAST